MPGHQRQSAGALLLRLAASSSPNPAKSAGLTTLLCATIDIVVTPAPASQRLSSPAAWTALAANRAMAQSSAVGLARSGSPGASAVACWAGARCDHH